MNHDIMDDEVMEESDGIDDETEDERELECERQQARVELRFRKVMEAYAYEINGVKTAKPIQGQKTSQFIRLCIQQETLVWKSNSVVSTKTHQRNCVEIKRFLENVAVEDETFDINHDLCFCFYNEAIRYEDLQWLRIMVEHGLDVGRFDQDSLTRWAIMAKQASSEESVDADKNADKVMMDFLIDTLGIDVHTVDSPEDSFIMKWFWKYHQMDFILIERGNYRSHPRVDQRSVLYLPLYRYYLEYCGCIPFYFKYLHNSLLDDFYDDEVMDMLIVVIENEQYGTVNPNEIDSLMEDQQEKKRKLSSSAADSPKPYLCCHNPWCYAVSEDMLDLCSDGTNKVKSLFFITC
jgi:hypothetical protein